MSTPLNLEARLAAVEAELAAIKRQLGITVEASPPVLAPQIVAADQVASPKALEASATQAGRSGWIGVAEVETDSGATAPAERSAEVALGSYWVTRIGAVLVLLAAVFLAGYLSIFSSPPIRIGELIGATLAALGIAYWQERRGNVRFALVLHSLGDALGFFTAFAAYAFDATQVIDSVSTAIVVQALAGAAVCAHAIQRRSEGSAVFALTLLVWVAGFSFSFHHSGTALGFVAALALIGAVLRLRLDWNLPLAFAAVASPAIAVWIALDFSTLRTAMEVTLAVLPLVVAVPFLVSRDRITRSDRFVYFLGLGCCIAGALILRYSGEASPFIFQLLVEAAVCLGLAGLFFLRGDETGIGRGLAFQSGFLAAATAALYLLSRYRVEPLTPAAILGLGIGAALLLRPQRRWVSGYCFLVFCLFALIWQQDSNRLNVPLGDAAYWAGLGMIVLAAALVQIALAAESIVRGVIAGAVTAGALIGVIDQQLATSHLAILTWLAVTVAAAAAARRFPGLVAWSIAALAFAHFRIFAGDGSGGLAGSEGLLSLFLLAAVDAAALAAAGALHQTKIHPLPLIVPLLMLGTLYHGFAGAHLSWSATYAWVPLAGGLFLIGFLRANPSYRVAALAAFGICLVRLFAEDLNSAFTRIVAFFLLGIILLGIGYLYTRLGRRSAVEGATPPLSGNG